MSLSYAQLEGTWLQAAAGTKYATKPWAALMAAIAEAESGGNPNATNPTDNDGTQTSWGLWQISLGNHAEPSPNWNNPEVNAKLAIGKLDSQGLGAWGTYTSGAYKAYINGSTTPDTSGITGGSAVQAAQLTAASKTQADCAWSVGWGGIPGSSWLSNLFGDFIPGSSPAQSGGNLGSGEVCLASKSQVRGAAGAGFMLLGGILMLSGLGLIALQAGLKVAGPILATTTPVGRAASVVSRVSGGSSPAPPRPAVADRQGTSPEFRQQYGLGA
jgi:hypothetical protein